MIRPERDPHWLLGVEHRRCGVPRETTWGDPEHRRRYDAGYDEHGTTVTVLYPPDPTWRRP